MNQQLDTDKQQQQADGGLEVAETGGHTSQQKEHGAQTKDSKDVGKEHHIGIERHGEDGRNAVESEDEVAKFNENDCNEKWGHVEMTATVLPHNFIVLPLLLGPHKESIAVETGEDTKMTGEKLHHRMGGDIHLLFLVALEKHLDATIDEENSEDKQYPVELGNDRGTEKIKTNRKTMAPRMPQLSTR